MGVTWSNSGKDLAKWPRPLAKIIWGFPEMGVPQNGWFRMENPSINGWSRRYPHFRKPPFSYHSLEHPWYLRPQEMLQGKTTSWMPSSLHTWHSQIQFMSSVQWTVFSFCRPTKYIEMKCTVRVFSQLSQWYSNIAIENGKCFRRKWSRHGSFSMAMLVYWMVLLKYIRMVPPLKHDLWWIYAHVQWLKLPGSSYDVPTSVSMKVRSLNRVW